MYSKYHGCGNDFIIGKYQSGNDYSLLARKYCDRHLGIGADGLLLVEKENNNITMHLYNSDGSIAPMCGNGIRCFANYCLDEGLINENDFIVNTLSGPMRIIIESRDPFFCKVNLGKPDFSSEKLSIDTKKNVFIDEKLKVNDIDVSVSAVYMATHHLVILVNDLNKAIESKIAEVIAENKIFLVGINVNLVEIIDRKNIKMKTFERGAGWTLACGTGASAAYSVLRKKNLCDNELSVHLELGILKITSINDEIIMSGPSKCVAKEVKFV